MEEFLNKIHHGDSQELLQKLPESCIDLTVTSPPYKDEDNYSPNLIKNVFTEIFRVQKDNSLVFVNFGHLAGFKSRPFQVAMMLEEIGFVWQDTITWVKNHYRPIQGKKRVNNLTEFVFMFSKGKNYELDRLSIGVPYKDKSNVNRFAGGLDLKCQGNVWDIPYETIQRSEDKGHNDRYPLGLPMNCIKLSGIPQGSLVLDPFGGSATTAIACIDLAMKWILIEKNKEHVDNGRERISLWEKALDSKLF